MKTKILKPTKNNLILASKKILAGEVVCYPTDTIYGLATNPFDDKGVKKIFEAKGRPENKPIIVLIPENFDLDDFVVVPVIAKKLIKKYWPGALTIIFKTKKNFSTLVSAGQDTIALRMPSNQTTLDLLKLTGPITSTSANLSGEKIVNNPKILKQIFEGKICFVIDGGILEDSALPSTLVDASKENLVLLRQGKIVLQAEDFN